MDKNYDKNIEYLVEYCLDDFITIKTTASTSEVDNIISLLKTNLNQTLDISVSQDPDCAAVMITSESKDHEANYKLFENALSIVKSQYTVDKATVNLDNRQFSELHIYWSIQNPEILANIEENDINALFTENSINARFNEETCQISLPPDITIEELFEYGAFMSKNFNAKLSCQFLCDNPEIYSLEINMLSGNMSNLYGDANLDNNVNIADAVLVMQVATNPDKYAQGKSKFSISAQGEVNADVDGKSGLTNEDALLIQKFKLGLIDEL